jgi:hypothetical protein
MPAPLNLHCSGWPSYQHRRSWRDEKWIKSGVAALLTLLQMGRVASSHIALHWFVSGDHIKVAAKAKHHDMRVVAELFDDGGAWCMIASCQDVQSFVNRHFHFHLYFQCGCDFGLEQQYCWWRSTVAVFRVVNTPSIGREHNDRLEHMPLPIATLPQKLIQS